MESRILIFEDNNNLRQSLIVLFKEFAEYEVIGDYPNVLDAADIVKALNPDIVILDIDMPEKDGISAIPLIKEIDPGILIIMYTQFEDEDKIFNSLCAGADGYILKKTSPLKLCEAIEDVRKGGAPLSPSIARKVLASFHSNLPSGIQYNLTQREIEVLKLLIKGYSVKYIASELNVAYETCRSHLKNIYTKLQVNCGKEAIAKILEEKINLR